MFQAGREILVNLAATSESGAVFLKGTVVTMFLVPPTMAEGEGAPHWEPV